MTTFVTGGTSSIGRVLIRELSRKGEPLTILVRKSSNRTGLELPGVNFVWGDVTDYESVLRGMQGCQRVTHMAAAVGGCLPEEQWWCVNRDGSRNVLQAAQELRVESMVQVSSMSVLGHTQPGEIADETRPIDTTRYANLYQKTKFAADEIARDFAARGLPVKIVYPAFGFGCSFAASHPSLQDQTLLRMAAGEKTAIMGSGKNQLFLAYYNDTVDAIQLAHQLGRPGEGYLLGNENLTFPQIWQAVAEVLGKKAPRQRIPLWLLRGISTLGETLRGKPIFTQDFFEMVGLNWCFSNQKARRELGWQPMTFRNAIRRTWEEYQLQGWQVKE